MAKEHVTPLANSNGNTNKLAARLQQLEFEDQVASNLVETRDVTKTVSLLNLSMGEFQEIASRPSFQDKLWRLVTARIVMPQLPNMVQALMNKCMEKPSPIWTKLVLSMIGKSGTEKHEEHKHIHLAMSDEQLKARTMQMLSSARGAVDLGMDEIKDILERV